MACNYRQRPRRFTGFPRAVTVMVEEAERGGQGKGRISGNVRQAGGMVKDQIIGIGG